ncbi:hypothetical protein Kpol_1018p151, partial [Vanderwaltozyma polyspora DSM 70294]
SSKQDSSHHLPSRSNLPPQKNMIPQLVENPDELLRDVRESFRIQQDIDSIGNINNSINTLNQLSKDKLNEQRFKISETTLNIDTTSSAIEILVSDLNRIQNEASQFSSNNTLELELNSLQDLENSVVDLRKKLDSKITNLVNAERSLAATTSTTTTTPTSPVPAPLETALEDPVVKSNLLKLKLYRSLGVIVDSENNQVLIHLQNGEFDVLPLDNNLSGYFLTKYIWDKLQQKYQY